MRNAKEWKCLVCDYIHKDSEPPDECPQCGASADQFEEVESGGDAGETAPAFAQTEAPSEEYLGQWARTEDDFDKKYARIQHLAKTGKSESTAMRTRKAFPDWDTILFNGAQLFRMPLNEDESVSCKTIIGKTAKQPLELDIPFYVSHMSFGALSREAKIALARGSRLAGTAICSGEGGMLPAERDEAAKYIYELGTAEFSHRDENILKADAVEIKIGQAAKPGMGGHLPAEKVTEEIASIRNIPVGKSSISPGRHAGIDNPDDLKAEVSRIRKLTGGKPVGVKITAGHIELDLEAALYAEPDFVTIDFRGGGTGSAPVYVKDNVCLPPIFGLYRARKYLDQAGSGVTLCVTGGFRDSTDIAKALAMGADAVALATASMIAIGCQQYRVCHTGKCPVGIATQDPTLRARFDIEKSAERFVNFYGATRSELENLARINGRNDVHALDKSDIFTISSEVASHTDIEHA
jgi:glutamate synthase domain-containing protein 2